MKGLTGEHWNAPFESNCPPCHRIDHCVCHGRVCRATGPRNGNGHHKPDQHYYHPTGGVGTGAFSRSPHANPFIVHTFDPLAQTLGTSSTALLAIEVQRLMRTW
jgi:hypothetical protein